MFIKNNIDKLPLLKTAFRPVGEAAMAFVFKKCCTTKGQRFRYLTEKRFRTYLSLVYTEIRKGLYCKYCAIFSTFFVNWGWEKSSKIWKAKH